MPIISYFHLSFTVSDIERSVEFYRDVMGFKLVHRMIHDQAYTSSQIGFANAYLKVALFTIPNMPQGQAPSGHLLELIGDQPPRRGPPRAASRRHSC
jgi:catechol 2,3-dioxygenase-like lactoylglutathione lyase family enzyme